MKNKKIILYSGLVVVIIIGIVFGVYQYNKSQIVANVQNVGLLNMGWYQDEIQSDGMVTNDESQVVYLDNTQVIKEIYVTQGQEVSVGDPIIAFDKESLGLTLDMKRLEIQSLQQNYEATKKELDRIKNIEPSEPVHVDKPNLPEEKVQVDGTYNYLEALSDGKKDETETTYEKYIFKCHEDTFVLGSFINEIRGKENVKALIQNKNGEVIKVITYKSFLQTCSDDSKWKLLTGEPIVDEITPPQEETYTKDELSKMINEKERELKSIDLSIRQQQLALDQLEQEVEDGTVYATISGTVKDVGDKDNIPNDGSPFISIVGSEGLYVKGQIGELMLDKVFVGQDITLTSWETGGTYQAKIKSIDNYPSDRRSWGMGNPISSFYSFTAYIENASDLRNGQYLSISFNPSPQQSGSLYLETMYVREEDGKSYVMKDENGKLVKQYVTTGKIVSGGYMIEVKDGLTTEDYIAFPYGKEAAVGTKTNKEG